MDSLGLTWTRFEKSESAWIRFEMTELAWIRFDLRGHAVRRLDFFEFDWMCSDSLADEWIRFEWTRITLKSRRKPAEKSFDLFVSFKGSSEQVVCVFFFPGSERTEKQVDQSVAKRNQGSCEPSGG